MEGNTEEKKKVLLLVNHWREPNQYLIKQFSDHGFEVRSVRNSQEARNSVGRDGVPDVVAMPLIPEGGLNSGLSLIGYLREKFSSLKIIAWTNCEEVMNQAMRAGVNMIAYGNIASPDMVRIALA